MQDKKPLNEQGEAHGYWEIYHGNGQPSFRINYINGAWYGYFEHNFNNKIRKQYAAR
jgi:hypothetical protein